MIGDRLGAERGAGAQESGVLQAGAERFGVVLDADGAGHVQERLQFGGGEVPDQPEVQEGDLAAAVEQVVARVRVAVEGAHLVQAAEDEAVDGLGGQVAFVLGPAGEFGEAGAAGQLAGDHPAGGQLVDDRGDADGGVAVVAGGHQVLAGGLAAVVELLADPVSQLADQRAGVLGRGGDAEHPADQRDVAQVGRDGLGDARVLDLDGDVRAWRHLPQLSADDRPIRPWLFRVARNLLIDANRAERARPMPVPGQSAGEIGTDSELEEILDRQLVSAALQHLSPAHQSVLVETFYRGGTMATVARELGIPHGTARSRLHYALDALRQHLEEHDAIAAC